MKCLGSTKMFRFLLKSEEKHEYNSAWIIFVFMTTQSQNTILKYMCLYGGRNSWRSKCRRSHNMALGMVGIFVFNLSTLYCLFWLWKLSVTLGNHPSYTHSPVRFRWVVLVFVNSGFRNGHMTEAQPIRGPLQDESVTQVVPIRAYQNQFWNFSWNRGKWEIECK